MRQIGIGNKNENPSENIKQDFNHRAFLSSLSRNSLKKKKKEYFKKFLKEKIINKLKESFKKLKSNNLINKS